MILKIKTLGPINCKFMSPISHKLKLDQSHIIPWSHKKLQLVGRFVGGGSMEKEEST
jgi:hypothetical protein